MATIEGTTNDTTATTATTRLRGDPCPFRRRAVVVAVDVVDVDVHHRR